MNDAKIHERCRIKELRKAKTFSPSKMKSVKQFNSYESLNLRLQKLVGKMPVFLDVFTPILL